MTTMGKAKRHAHALKHIADLFWVIVDPQECIGREVDSFTLL